MGGKGGIQSGGPNFSRDTEGPGKRYYYVRDQRKLLKKSRGGGRKVPIESLRNPLRSTRGRKGLGGELLEPRKKR